MPATTDVRDVWGRTLQLLVAIPLGLACSLVVTYLLPTRNHFAGSGCCMCGTGWFVEGGNPTLVLVGAVGFTLAISALFSAARRGK